MKAPGSESDRENLTFSVVIPTFNRPEPLRNCLDSLVNQRFPHDRFEVIVVDDGGTLSAQTVVEEFKDRISITICRQERSGPAGARNAGAFRSRSKYIAFLDDDCYADPVWLQELETAFSATNSRSLLGGFILNAIPENVFAEVGESILAVILQFYRPEPGGVYFFRAANLAASLNEFQEIGGFDVDFRTAEDREFSDRWLHKGGSLLHVPNARVAHLKKLSFGTFCRQHFLYGKGAFHFHRVRRVRRSGKFHVNHLLFYLRVFRAACRPTQSSIPIKLCLLIVWQAMNVAGFLWAFLEFLLLQKERKS